MAIQEVNDLITVRVPTTEKGYEDKDSGRRWTKSSEPGIWAEGVSYCGIRGAKMQTLDDAVEFRHGSNGADGSSNYQHTGTLIALVNDGKVVRAHIYEPEQDELEKLASREDVKAGCAYFIDVDSTGDLGKRIIDSTNTTGRTFIIPNEKLRLSVLPADGVTDYGKNEVVLQLMPRCAEKNAAYMQARGVTKDLSGSTGLISNQSRCESALLALAAATSSASTPTTTSAAVAVLVG